MASLSATDCHPHQVIKPAQLAELRASRPYRLCCVRGCPLLSYSREPLRLTQLWTDSLDAIGFGENGDDRDFLLEDSYLRSDDEQVSVVRCLVIALSAS